MSGYSFLLIFENAKNNKKHKELKEDLRSLRKVKRRHKITMEDYFSMLTFTKGINKKHTLGAQDVRDSFRERKGLRRVQCDAAA